MARQRATKRRSKERHRSPAIHPGETDNGWKVDAACASTHPAVFFPPDSWDEVPADAAAICAGCPVSQPCLNYAIANHELGVWAGTTRTQRDRLVERTA